MHYFGIALKYPYDIGPWSTELPPAPLYFVYIEFQFLIVSRCFRTRIFHFFFIFCCRRLLFHWRFFFNPPHTPLLAFLQPNPCHIIRPDCANANNLSPTGWSLGSWINIGKKWSYTWGRNNCSNQRGFDLNGACVIVCMCGLVQW